MVVIVGLRWPVDQFRPWPMHASHWSVVLVVEKPILVNGPVRRPMPATRVAAINSLAVRYLVSPCSADRSVGVLANCWLASTVNVFAPAQTIVHLCSVAAVPPPIAAGIAFAVATAVRAATWLKVADPMAAIWRAQPMRLPYIRLRRIPQPGRAFPIRSPASLDHPVIERREPMPFDAA